MLLMMQCPGYNDLKSELYDDMQVLDNDLVGKILSDSLCFSMC